MALGIDNLLVGSFTDHENQTGCTVVLPPAGTVGGMAVRGGAPGTREAAALGPNGTVRECHAVVLCGSSLFGLAAADGVVAWCVDQGRGLELAAGRFPIVGAAVVLDLIDPSARRIDRDAGFAACRSATSQEPAMGSVGVGTGCTVGKEAGREFAMKGGQGWAVKTHGSLSVGALMAVNALGSVYGEDGRLLAGCTAPDGVPRFPFTARPPLGAGALANTVIGCIATNARLDKAQACRVADLAHTGVARSVSPAHTSFDGDALFTLATGEVSVSLDLVAYLAAEAVAAAVRAGVRAAEALPGRPVDSHPDVEETP